MFLLHVRYLLVSIQTNMPIDVGYDEPNYVVYFCMLLILRRLMSYIYGASILDISRSHTTTQHSR